MAALTQARLVDDDGTGEEVLRFDDSIGVVVTRLDLGFPEIRSSGGPRPSQDGTLDSTKYIGARTVTAELLMPSVAWYLVEDQIRAAVYPQNRFYLYVLRDGWLAERRMLVRGAGYTESGGVRSPTAQVQWVATQGFMEEEPDQVGLVPTFTNDEGGNPFPRTYPRFYAPGFSPGVSVVQVDGNIPVSPVATIYGPCANPALTLGDSTGKTLAFNTTIADGHYLYVDFAARTALLDNDPALSLYGTLDFTRSTWWQLTPGSQSVAFRPSKASGASQAVLSWRPRYI